MILSVVHEELKETCYPGKKYPGKKYNVGISFKISFSCNYVQVEQMNGIVVSHILSLLFQSYQMLQRVRNSEQLHPLHKAAQNAPLTVLVCD